MQFSACVKVKTPAFCETPKWKGWVAFFFFALVFVFGVMSLFAVEDGHLARKPAGKRDAGRGGEGGCWKQEGSAVQKVQLGQRRVVRTGDRVFFCCPPFSAPAALCRSPLGFTILLAPRGAPRAVCGTSGTEPGMPKLLRAGGCTCGSLSTPVQEG